MSERLPNVNDAIERAGLTQQQLGDELGLSQAAISDRKRGRTPWRVAELRIVAQLTGRPLAELLEDAA